MVFSGDNFPFTDSKCNQWRIKIYTEISAPDLLIVTHPIFNVGSRTASVLFRAQEDQLEVLVVTPEEIYNEFSSGRQDVTAIRDFAKYLYEKDEKLKYLLLFGRSSYDYKNTSPRRNTNYVPTYQSRNSIDPIL